MKIKLIIFIMLFTAFVSCNQKSKTFEGTWCISKVDYNLNNQIEDSLNLEQILVLNMASNDKQPSNIAITKDTIKLLFNSEITDKMYYRIEKTSDNITSVLLDNKYKAIITKSGENFNLQSGYISIFFTNCK